MTFAWKPIKEYSDIRFELFEGIGLAMTKSKTKSES